MMAFRSHIFARRAISAPNYPRPRSRVRGDISRRLFAKQEEAIDAGTAIIKYRQNTFTLLFTASLGREEMPRCSQEH